MTTTFEGLQADFGFEPIEGYLHTGERLSVPLISHIVDNLYVGGHADRLDLGDFFSHVFSLYVWGAQYPTHADTVHHSLTLRDSPTEDLAEVNDFVDLVVDALEAGGNVLVHCQAGINRSNLVAAMALRRWKGMTSAEAIALLRAQRTPLVLANRGFERFLNLLDDPEPVEDYPGGGE